MQVEVQTKSLRERVDEALAKYKADGAASEQERIKKDREALARKVAKVLGFYPEEEPQFSMNGERVEVVIEGLRFALNWGDRGDYLVLVQTCPKCQKDDDRAIYNLAAIGLALEGDLSWRHKDGRCLTAEANAESTEERLINVLRDFIAENSQPE